MSRARTLHIGRSLMLLGALALLGLGCSDDKNYECVFDTDCEGGKVCQNGVCVDAADPCLGVTCDTPPASACIDGQTLRTFASAGRCVDGDCVYDHEDIPCSQGCADGHCLGDPCAGVVCDTPPAPVACYATPGTCSSGACRYDYADGASCDDGDACTLADACAQGRCAGQQMRCTDPPANACDGDVAIIYEHAGRCSDGACAYGSQRVECAQGCEGGACIGEPCAGVVCNSPPDAQCYQPEGYCAAEPSVHCVYDALADGTECDDGDACTGPDACTRGECGGVPIVCDSPPDNQCTAASRLLTYDANGSCSGGECSYRSNEVDCDFGCEERAGDDVCVGDPCDGVVCDSPPAPECIDGSTRRTYDGGYCVEGDCRYAPHDQSCAFGCSNGQCNADPCAGTAHCSDGQQSCDEDGIDCGGADCPPCEECYPAGSSAEILGRGLVALPRDGKVYLGWRLLPWDDPNAGFHVFRGSALGGPYAQISSAPVSATTDYFDASAASGTVYFYVVRTVDGSGQLGPESQPARARAGAAQGYVRFQPNGADGAVDLKRAAVGDVNGDGQMDLVALMYAEADGGVAYRLEAFVSAGGEWVSQWRVSTGMTPGRDMPLSVWDLDGDARGEVIARTSRGVTVLDGATGVVRASSAWPCPHSPGYANMAIAYLGDRDGDGRLDPSIVINSCGYGAGAPPTFTAYRFTGNALAVEREMVLPVDNWDADHPQVGAMGTHGLIAADLDNDGDDEIMPCGSILYHDWSGYWSPNPHHCDGCFVGNIMPGTPKPELYMACGHPADAFLINLNANGPSARLWEARASLASGWDKAWCSDISSAHPGMECYTSELDETISPIEECAHVFSSSGQDISSGFFGDPTNYHQCRGLPLDWLHGDGSKELVRYMCPGITPPSCIAWPSWPVEVFGDAREEVIAFDAASGEIRIYTNTASASSRHVTPLADRGYRAGVSRVAMGYHTNFVCARTGQQRFDAIPGQPCGPCQGKPAGTVCRGASGLCDAAETCDGASADCPPDAFAPAGTLCRASTAGCDPQELCTGSSPACPADVNDCNTTLYLYLDNGPHYRNRPIDLAPEDGWGCYEYLTDNTPCTHDTTSCNCCERDGNDYRVFFRSPQNATGAGEWVSAGRSEAAVGSGCAPDPDDDVFPCYRVACGSR